MAWENLPMRDRATIIKLGVQSGLRDINSIKETYNKFADGGRVNRKFKWDKANKGTTITNLYGETYHAEDNTRGLFQQTEDNSWTPVSVEQARDIYVPNVTDPVNNSYTQLGPMPTLTVTSPDWETVPYNVEDTRFGGRTPITNINVRRNKNTGKILPEDYRQVLAIKDWYAKQHPKSDPSENALNDAVFTALTLGANKNLETTAKGISSLVSKVDPVVKSAVKNYIAKPLIAGSIWDNAQQLVFGQSGTEYFTNYLVNKGWSPIAASIVGASTNPAYLVNFEGGLASNKLSNNAKTLLGIESKNELGSHLWNPTYQPGPLQTALRNYIDKKHPLGIYATVPQKEGKILVDFNGNKINFDPTEPITNSEFYYPIKLPFVGKFYKEFSLADGPALYYAPKEQFAYNLLNDTQRTGPYIEVGSVNGYRSSLPLFPQKAKFTKRFKGNTGEESFSNDYSQFPKEDSMIKHMMTKKDPQEIKSEYDAMITDPEYTFLAPNRINLIVDYSTNPLTVPLSPKDLETFMFYSGNEAFDRVVGPKLKELYGNTDLILGLSPKNKPPFDPLIDSEETRLFIKNAAFKQQMVDLKHLREIYSKQPHQVHPYIQFGLDAPAQVIYKDGVGYPVVDPLQLSKLGSTLDLVNLRIPQIANHELAGHLSEYLLPAREYYQYAIPKRQDLFNKSLEELIGNETFEYLFDPGEVRADLIVTKSWLAQHQLPITKENLKLANKIVGNSQRTGVLSDKGWDWLTFLAKRGYAVLPFIGTGASLMNNSTE